MQPSAPGQLMFIFLIVFLIADAVLLLSAHFDNIAQFARVCDVMAPLCGYPAPMLILGIIAAGILMLQR
jgi:hypothetical protein